MDVSSWFILQFAIGNSYVPFIWSCNADWMVWIVFFKCSVQAMIHFDELINYRHLYADMIKPNLSYTRTGRKTRKRFANWLVKQNSIMVQINQNYIFWILAFAYPFLSIIFIFIIFIHLLSKYSNLLLMDTFVILTVSIPIK